MSVYDRPRMKISLAVTMLLAALAACGSPRTPADEDACHADGDCGGGLVCCHTTGDSPSTVSAQPNDRGFCVKAAVCEGVPVPSQAPLPPE
jgi:hypothetical protein